MAWISLQTASLFFTHNLRFSSFPHPRFSGVVVLKSNHVSRFLRGNVSFIVLMETISHLPMMLVLLTSISTVHIITTHKSCQRHVLYFWRRLSLLCKNFLGYVWYHLHCADPLLCFSILSFFKQLQQVAGPWGSFL